MCTWNAETILGDMASVEWFCWAWRWWREQDVYLSQERKHDGILTQSCRMSTTMKSRRNSSIGRKWGSCIKQEPRRCWRVRTQVWRLSLACHRLSVLRKKKKGRRSEKKRNRNEEIKHVYCRLLRLWWMTTLFSWNESLNVSPRYDYRRKRMHTSVPYKRWWCGLLLILILFLFLKKRTWRLLFNWSVTMMKEIWCYFQSYTSVDTFLVPQSRKN